MNLNSIGFLIVSGKRHRVVCNECIIDYEDVDEEREFTPIFKENIYPYWQTCYRCHSLLVIGRAPSLPELF